MLLEWADLTALKRLRMDDKKYIKLKLKHREFSFPQHIVTQTQYTWPWPHQNLKVFDKPIKWTITTNKV